MSKKKKAVDIEDIDIAIAGGETLQLDNNLVVKVYPLGLRHLRKFNTKIKEFLPILADVFVPVAEGEKEAKDRDVIQSMMVSIGPKILEDFFEILEDCVIIDSEVTLEFLPHYYLAPIAEKWIEVSFGTEKKWNPWIQAIDNIVSRYTKKAFSIRAIFSKPSSPVDTAEETSSTNDNETPMVDTGHTLDGPSPSSSSGEEEHSVSISE